MCCRVNVYPIVPNLAATQLLIGQFEPIYWLPGRDYKDPIQAVNWERVIPEEGTIVRASITNESLDLNISPAISTYSHHYGKRITAGVYFEIAAKYAERVDGQMIQRATVVGCKPSNSNMELIIASYPLLPLDYSKICPGFQAVILGDHYHAD